MGSSQEDLRAKGQAIWDTVLSLREKMEEQERLLFLLANKAALYLRGVDPEEIATFKLDRNPLGEAHVTMKDGSKHVVPQRLFLKEPLKG